MAEATDKAETMDVDKIGEKENGTTDGPVASSSAAPEAIAAPSGTIHGDSPVFHR